MTTRSGGSEQSQFERAARSTGDGDPNTSSEYAEAVEALDGVAYAVKFESKKALERDFAVGSLEGLWRSGDMSSFVTRDKSAWNWTMIIGQPDWITEDMVAAAVDIAGLREAGISGLPGAGPDRNFGEDEDLFSGRRVSLRQWSGCAESTSTSSRNR